MVKLLDITAAVEVDINSAWFSCGGRGSSGYTVSSCGPVQ